MRRRFWSSLLGTALVSGGLVIAAAPAYANTCASATDMGTSGAAEMGTKTQNGTVGLFTPEQWWQHSTNLTNRTVSIAPLDGADSLEVYKTDCTTLICSAPSSNPTCTVPQSGLVKIRVIHDPTGGTSSNYSVTATGLVPGECNDNVDNDGDGFTDFPNDPHCTSATDATESPVHVAAYGHITITGHGGAAPTYIVSGVYGDTTKFNCSLTYTPIGVACTQVFNPEVIYDCTHFILTASAPGPTAPSGATGNVSGRLSCDSGAVLVTNDVNGSGAAGADNTQQGINLGSANPVSCRAAGVNGAANATGYYQVDCWEPGVAWPVENVKNPLGH